MSINKALISGFVGSDAELSATAGGTTVCNFSIAVNEWRKDGDDYTSWIRCTLFNSRAEKLSPYIKKGTKLCVSGSLHQYRYEKDGENRSNVSLTVDDVEFMSRKGGDVEETVTSTFGGAQVSPISDDELPF